VKLQSDNIVAVIIAATVITAQQPFLIIIIICILDHDLHLSPVRDEMHGQDYCGLVQWEGQIKLIWVLFHFPPPLFTPSPLIRPHGQIDSDSITTQLLKGNLVLGSIQF
jgi:hypothetical protein